MAVIIKRKMSPGTVGKDKVKKDRLLYYLKNALCSPSCLNIFLQSLKESYLKTV
jgi:hypothetical protein